jgi:hypothetical protein
VNIPAWSTDAERDAVNGLVEAQVVNHEQRAHCASTLSCGSCSRLSASVSPDWNTMISALTG